MVAKVGSVLSALFWAPGRSLLAWASRQVLKDRRTEQGQERLREIPPEVDCLSVPGRKYKIMLYLEAMLVRILTLEETG
jgi:hypothetical protein